MKTPSLIALLLVALSFPALAERPILIKCVVGSGKDALVFGPSKSPMEASATKEQRYASSFDLPKLEKNSEGQQIVFPITPLSFEVIPTGWSMQCAAEPLGDLIRLNGAITYTEPELTQAVFGEHSGRIYAPGKKKVLLSENVSRTATVHSSSSPFQVFAVPGKEYEFKIRRLNKWVPCRISCVYAAK